MDISDFKFSVFWKEKQLYIMYMSNLQTQWSSKTTFTWCQHILLENGENCDSSKTWTSIPTMLEQFVNSRKLKVKNLLQDFDTKEM